MATYSKFSELISGVQRQVDLSTNTLLVQALELSNGTTNLTQTLTSGGSSYAIAWPPSQASSSTFLQNDGAGNLSWASAGSGSVTSVSVTSANGFAGTVATPTSTPAITIETTITATILAGNGTAISAAALPVNEIFVGNISNLPVAVAVSGDATLASSGALTLSTVNSNVGSFGSSTSIPSFTVNAKGLITAASGNAVVAPAGTLTGTTLASNVVTSSLTSLGVQSAALNMGGFQINDLASPSVSSDAANKGYVDAAINGLTWKGPVQAYAASNTATSGYGLVIDSYSVMNGDYVILANQSPASGNYVYLAAVSSTVYHITTTSGTGTPVDGDTFLDTTSSATGSVTSVPSGGPNYSFEITVASGTVSPGDTITTSSGFSGTVATISSAYTLTEVTGFEAPTAIGDAYLVEKGTVYGNSAFQVNAISPNVTFIQFAGPNFYTFMAPLSLTGTTVSLDYSNGLTVSGSALEVEASDASILVASGGISVQEDPAGAIITGGSGIKIQLNPTNPGLAISTNELDVKYNASGAIIATSTGIAVQVLSTGGIQISSDSLALKLVASTALVTSSSGLAWQFDNSTIGVNGSNQAYVPNAGITDVQINTNVFDQATITGGAGTPASVAHAPALEFAGVAGQTFSANTTYALRYGIVANSETAGRLYAADYAPGSPVTDQFWVVGFLASGAGFVAGNSITVIKIGSLTLGSSDTDFMSNDNGTPIFLQGSGSFAPVSSATLNVSGNANAKIGIVTSTTTFLADIGSPSVY